MLQIRPTQYNLLTESYLAHKILRFLKQQLPEKCNKTDADMIESICQYIKLAKQYDIKTERSLAKWSYLFLLTDEKLLNINGVKEYLEQPTPLQNIKVDRLMKSMAVGCKLMNLDAD